MLFTILCNNYRLSALGDYFAYSHIWSKYYLAELDI